MDQTKGLSKSISQKNSNGDILSQHFSRNIKICKTSIQMKAISQSDSVTIKLSG